MFINLKEKFIEAISSAQDLKNEEKTTVLLTTPWVRILLEQESEVISIEVEVTIPEDASCDKKDSSIIFDQFTEHINYLQKLRDQGFDLCIGAGCIFIASKSLTKTPEDNLFRALVPP